MDKKHENIAIILRNIEIWVMILVEIVIFALNFHWEKKQNMMVMWYLLGSNNHVVVY